MSNETNWTPGPWRYAIPGDRHVMSTCGHMPYVCGAPQGKKSRNKEWQANAHLIAAAPDLYCMLDRIVNHHTAGRELNWPDIDQSLAALAKARGES